MAHIHINNIRFSYPVFQMTGRSLKLVMLNRVSGVGSGLIKVPAIRDLNLKFTDGDRVGLVGRNGSGKSTLLRLIAGLAHPDVGRVDIQGRVVPLIERGLGINPELSGLNNIELPLRLLGATDAEILHARTWVPQFAGLGDFIHLPVRTYSEGMKARLAFALCTSVRGDILVLDEWLSAGDINFTDKAEAALTDVVNQARILVLASHSLELLRTVCTRVVWMEKGGAIMDGPTDEVIDAYVERMHEQAAAQASQALA